MVKKSPAKLSKKSSKNVVGKTAISNVNAESVQHVSDHEFSTMHHAIDNGTHHAEKSKNFL